MSVRHLLIFTLFAGIMGVLSAGPAAAGDDGFFTLRGRIEDPAGLMKKGEMEAFEVTAELSGNLTMRSQVNELGSFRVDAVLPVLRVRVTHPDLPYSRTFEGPWLKDAALNWEISET